MSSQPLLNPSSDAAAPAKPAKAPSPFAKGLLTFVGVTRAAFGVGCVLAPYFTLSFMGLPALSPEASVAGRLFGVREIIIGEFLLLAERSAAAKRGTPAQNNDELHRAIWCNVATDGLDAVALAIAFAYGSLEGATFAKMLATALLYTAAGVETAWLYS